jgi:hypothetical protein
LLRSRNRSSPNPDPHPDNQAPEANVFYGALPYAGIMEYTSYVLYVILSK